MALKFRCANCTAEIVSKFLKPGGQVKCPTCSEQTIVPENALTITEEEYTAWLRETRPGVPAHTPPSPAQPTTPNIPGPIDPALIGDINRTSIFDYFDAGWRSLSGRWGLAVGGFVVYMMISFLGQLIPVVSIFFAMLIAPVLGGGFALFFLNFARNTNPQIEDLFAGFQRYWTLMGINYTIGFCALVISLPLAIPILLFVDDFNNIDEVIGSHIVIFIMGFSLIMLGVMLIAAFLAFIYVVAMDTPPVGVFESIRRSFYLVRPHYWKVIGYFIISSLMILVSILFCLIPALFAVPLAQTAFMRLYLDLKADYERTQSQTPPAPQAPPESPYQPVQ